MKKSNLFDLTGKTAIITGGGRGLGAHFATAYAEAGVNIVLCSRKLENCQEVANELKSFGVKTLAVKCDITNEEDVKNTVEQAVAHFGQIDILVNNSGATWAAPVEDMPYSAWKKIIDVNVTGTFLMSQEVGKRMIKQKRGKIINISSIAGFRGSDPKYMNTIGYNTSKGAINTFTKDLAVKWGEHNVQVNAIAPGSFPTEMSKIMLEQGKDYFMAHTPLKRYGNEDDIKGVAVFLASRASDYITGDVIMVDGGMHAM
ncbi:MAG TPA: SDR family oxidoreductase [Bacilli bacterium]|nr:SDR family oxidoreductase [Bacilli bacterium]